MSRFYEKCVKPDRQWVAFLPCCYWRDAGGWRCHRAESCARNRGRRPPPNRRPWALAAPWPTAPARWRTRRATGPAGHSEKWKPTWHCLTQIVGHTYIVIWLPHWSRSRPEAVRGSPKCRSKVRVAVAWILYRVRYASTECGPRAEVGVRWSKYTNILQSSFKYGSQMSFISPCRWFPRGNTAGCRNPRPKGRPSRRSPCTTGRPCPPAIISDGIRRKFLSQIWMIKCRGLGNKVCKTSISRTQAVVPGNSRNKLHQTTYKPSFRALYVIRMYEWMNSWICVLVSCKTETHFYRNRLKGWYIVARHIFLF